MSGRQRAPSREEERILRWLQALEPLLDRRGPLTKEEAAYWRRRLPALIAGGELLRYRCGAGGEAAGLVAQALDEARCLLAGLRQAPEVEEALQPEGRRREPVPSRAADAISRAQAQVCRSAARREVEGLVREGPALEEVPPALAIAIPPGRAPGLRSFNLVFFAFLGFQTLLWGSGAVYGANAAMTGLYGLILAPFWWWGAYLLQGLVLALGREELSLVGRRALLRRPWLRPTELELAGAEAPVVCRECWFEINHHPVHCLTLVATNGRRVRFAVGRDAAAHERLMRQIEEHVERLKVSKPP